MLLPLTAGAQIIQPTDPYSLRSVIGPAPPETSRVNLLPALAHQYIFRKDELAGNLDTALLLNRKAGRLSRTLNHQRRQGLSYLTAVQAYHGKLERKEGKQRILPAIDSLNRYGSQAGQTDASTQPAACAFKYAFPGGPTGTVSLSPERPAHALYQLHHLRKRSGPAGWI